MLEDKFSGFFDASINVFDLSRKILNEELDLFHGQIESVKFKYSNGDCFVKIKFNIEIKDFSKKILIKKTQILSFLLDDLYKSERLKKYKLKTTKYSHEPIEIEDN